MSAKNDQANMSLVGHLREMAWQMLALCKQAAPALFEHAGPACVSGPCPEGKSTCGKAAEVREKAQNL